MVQVIQALMRALLGVFHPKMLLLTIAPFVVAGALWGTLGWAFWDEWTALFRTFLTESALGNFVRWLVHFTGVDLTLLLPPLLGMLIVVPLVAATAMLLIAIFGMPLIVGHISNRHYTGLDVRKGGTWLASAGNGLVVTLLLVLGWVLSLPLWLVPVVGPLVPLLLLGWATGKVFAYDALAEHADAQESAAIRTAHRWQLFALGALLAMFGSVPTLLWLAGALAVMFLPVMALVSVWLYGAVFVLSGLAFTHYCLNALKLHRAPQAPEITEQTFTDMRQLQ
jgi:hypothetical protein